MFSLFHYLIFNYEYIILIYIKSLIFINLILYKKLSINSKHNNFFTYNLI